jgi:hypothetical protein
VNGRRHPHGSHAVACGLALLLGFPGRAVSAPSSAEPVVPPWELALPDAPALELPALPDDPLAGPRGLGPDALVEGESAAYRLYMEGKRQLEAGELEAAERTFARALRTLPDEPPYARSRGSLAFWWVRTHLALFESTGDLAVLDREASLLAAYVERLDRIATSANDRAHKQDLVQQRLDEIAAVRRLRAAAADDVQTQLRTEHTGYRPSAWQPDTLQDLGWYPRRDDPRERSAQVTEDDDPEARREAAPEPGRTRRPGVGLVVGGAVSMAAGVAGMAVMGVGMARGARANDFDPGQSPMERREQIVAGADANTMSMTSAIAGGVVLATGIILISIGVKRMKKQPDPTRSSAALGPWGLRGRF